MSEAKHTCTCTVEGYSPDCPNVFLQGGMLLHTISNETRLKPRVYTHPEHTANISAASTDTEERDQPQESRIGIEAPVVQAKIKGESPIPKQWEQTQPAAPRRIKPPVPTLDALNELHPIVSHWAPSEEQYDDVINYFPDKLSLEPPRRDRMGKGNLSTDDYMTEVNRPYLRKFEPLSFNGQKITGASIGGFSVDLTKAAEKVREIAPLPPARLPIIFQDGDLNFYHHFFQGLEILMGRDIVISITSEDRYSDSSDLKVIPMIRQILESGYERTDNEITVFTKKVMSSTFEQDPAVQAGDGGTVLIVAANLYGFQYIEQGMQCKESDLRMWVSICYSHYRTIWFNTFKSAGVPAFALEGVQTRYESDGTFIKRMITNHPAPMRQGDLWVSEPRRSSRRSTAGSTAGSKKHRHRESESKSIFGFRT